jgi:hypothetical protein
MKKPTDRKGPKIRVCTFCLNNFTEDQIWWVDMKMHRSDPNCTSLYSVPTCGPCKDSPKNSWMVVGIAKEPKLKKVKKSKS